MKRMIGICVVLLLCALCVLSLAEDGFTLKNGSVQSIPEGMTEVVIPAEVNGEKVLSLSGYALANNREITEIVLPEGLRLLENGAVYANESAEKLILPDTLQVISTYNVYACHALREVVIPASVQYIGSRSFYSDDELRSVTFLGRAPLIAEDTFVWLNDDCTVYVPDDCLEEYLLALPEEITVKPSGKNAVPADRTLSEEELDFDPATGTVTGYRGASFAGEVPGEIGGVPVTAIGENAFKADSTSLRFLRLPEGLVTIGSGAFDHSKLLAVTFPSTLKTVGDYAFANSVELVPFWAEENGVEVIGVHAFEAVELPGSFRIPYGVREIGEGAFYRVSFSELYFPDTVETVGDTAFARSPYLKYIAFDGGDLPRLGEGMFDCQKTLEDVDIAWNATREQHEAACAVFAEMGMDKCTVWRNNPSSTGRFVIAGSGYRDGLLMSFNDSFSDVTVYTSFDGVDTVGVGEGCFENCLTIDSFYPHHCGWFVSFGARAFKNSSLKEVELFDSVTFLGDSAFEGTLLTEVLIPDSVTEMGSRVFASCESLTDVTVRCDPALLPDDTFASSPLVTLHVEDNLSVKECKALAERLNVKVDRPSGIPEDQACPYPATEPADFWIDEDFSRLDHYTGYELNLVLPREKNGVSLTMLSGNTLSRARGEDGAPAELPVRSVVVPEQYREIVYNAFNDLPDIEVIVIYAHLEQAFTGMFANCPALRAVVFVNGVDAVRANAFTGCPSLETVYLGPDAGLAADAFDSCGEMTAEKVLSALPDVDALLECVKSDPLTPPEEKPEAEMPDAEPITDPNAPAYLGEWNLQSMTMDGETIKPADFGITMTMILTDDGLAVIAQDEESDYSVWRMEEGVAYILADGESFAPAVIEADGSFTLAEDGISLTFVRGEAAPTVREFPEEALEYVGRWITEDGNMGVEILDNGTLIMIMDGESQQTVWDYEDGQARLLLGPGASVPMVITGEKLEIRADNMTMSFIREGGAPASLPADASPFTGNWHCIWMQNAALSCDPVAVFGGNWDFVIRADGTGTLYAGAETEAAIETDEDGMTRFNGMSVVIRADGRLQYGSDRSGGMIFSLVPGDTWDPARDAFADPAEAVIRQISRQGAEQTTEDPGTDASTSGELSDRIGIKYVAASATTGGYTLDTSMLGAEYAITFAKDGSAIFVMAGTPVPGLVWTKDASAFHITYFDGNDLVFTATPEGFDMDFYGALTYHFVPAQ